MRYVLLYLLIALISVSCIRDIDTDQVETASFSTPASLALLQSEFFPSDFLDANNTELAKASTIYLIDLSEFFYESKTDSLQMLTHFSNSFNRAFECYFEFVGSDANSAALITTDTFTVPPLSAQATRSVTFEGAEFELFTAARWIRVRVRLLNGLPFNVDDDINLSMQSVIHFNYELQP